MTPFFFLPFFFFQEKFAEYHVLDSVLHLLCLINNIQLEKLNQQISSEVGTVEQTILLENETGIFSGNGTGRPSEGGHITHVVSSPSENVSTVAEEGKYPQGRVGELPSKNYRGGDLCIFYGLNFVVW